VENKACLSKFAIVISFICPSIRPKNWIKLFENINDNNFEFEIIFLGPNGDSNYLPEKCRYIKTNIKPPQCFEGGISISKYDIICLLCDDIIFEKSNFLFEINKNIHELSNKKILSMKISSYGENLNKPSSEYNFIELPIGGVFKKKDFYEIGGIDSRFIATLYDVDLYLRLLQKGYQNFVLNVNVKEIVRTTSLEPSLYNRYAKIDKKTLKSFWFENDKFIFSKKRDVKSFYKQDLLFKTQAPYGQWKNQISYFSNLKYNNIYYFFDKVRRLEFNFIYNFYLRYKHLKIIKFLKKFIKSS